MPLDCQCCQMRPNSITWLSLYISDLFHQFSLILEHHIPFHFLVFDLWMLLHLTHQPPSGTAPSLTRRTLEPVIPQTISYLNIGNILERNNLGKFT